MTKTLQPFQHEKTDRAVIHLGNRGGILNYTDTDAEEEVPTQLHHRHIKERS